MKNQHSLNITLQTQFDKKKKKSLCCIKILTSIFSVPLSLLPIHSATPDTVSSAPPSPQSSHFSSFSSSLPFASPCPLPPPSPSSALRHSAPAEHQLRPKASVCSAEVSTSGQLRGEMGLRRRWGGAEGPGGGEGGGHVASCDRGRHPLRSCRWSPRQLGGQLRSSEPSTDEFALQ